MNKLSLRDVVTIDPEVMSGAPVFRGTRVPIQNLFDYMAGGYDLNRFLDGFPSVHRADAVSLLEFAYRDILKDLSQQKPHEITAG